MNTKQKRTLQAVYETPTRADIRFDDIVSLVEAYGGHVEKRAAGSRVVMSLGDRRAHIHRPHPNQIVGKCTVEDIRKFLIEAGI